MDILERIDELTAPTGRCRVCDHELDPAGVSVDFCSETHQQLWSQRRADRDSRALTDAEVRELLRQRGEQLQALAAAMRPAVAQLVSAFQSAARAFSAAMRDAGVVPPVEGGPGNPDVDVKARALALRQQRNTGPRVHADPRRNRR